MPHSGPPGAGDCQPQPNVCHRLTQPGSTDKQGSRPLRWALVEAVQRTPAGTPVHELKDAIIARRGIQARNIAKVAAARKLLTCVFYAMRDGHVRSLTARPAEREAG